MLFPLAKLLQGRPPPLSIGRDKTVHEALELMMEHDFSQLPIVDDVGNLVGIVSEESIIRTLFHTGGKVSLLKVTVDNCQTRAVTLPIESDLFEALDRLKDVYAIVVTRGTKPVGMLTDYDTTHFFRDISEGLIFVEDIESTLRQCIEAAFPTDAEMQAALMSAFGPDRRDPTRPQKEYESLSFYDHIQLITTERNWPKFLETFEPRQLFIQLMEQVRDVRNQLAHFRGRPDAVQYDALKRAVEWLEARQRHSPLPLTSSPESKVETAVDAGAGSPEGRYGPLQQWLEGKPTTSIVVQLPFAEVEAILGEPLPVPAREHRSWWSNDGVGDSQALAWLRAGWEVEGVDLSAERVTFRRPNKVLMQLFFTDLLSRLKAARPGITRVVQPRADTWFSFGAGKSGFSFEWVFGRDGLRVELYIDIGDREANGRILDTLQAQRDQIEESIGQTLTWNRAGQFKASRIYALTDFHITDPPDRLEQTRQWALDMMLRFVSAFQPRIGPLRW